MEIVTLFLTPWLRNLQRLGKWVIAREWGLEDAEGIATGKYNTARDTFLLWTIAFDIIISLQITVGSAPSYPFNLIV